MAHCDLKQGKQNRYYRDSVYAAVQVLPDTNHRVHHTPA